MPLHDADALRDHPLPVKSTGDHSRICGKNQWPCFVTGGASMARDTFLGQVRSEMSRAASGAAWQSTNGTT